MITIDKLRKNFGEKVAVNIADYTVQRGDLLGLVGNNGAGKTTFFRLLLDLLKADEGTVTYHFSASKNNEDGEGITVNPALSELWKEYTGAYIDEGFLIDFFTPEEYFSFIGSVCGMEKDTIEARQNDFEQLMGGEIIGQKKLIRDLSAGNKQKVGIIAALFNKPEVVILDEPFNFLDPSSQNILKHLLAEYNRETGATILISSHNLAHTIDICPRITLMEAGEIKEDFDNKNGEAREKLEDYFKA